MLHLVGIGAANVDLLLYVSRFPLPDQETSVTQFHMQGGGSAANVAVGVSRLGLSSGFIGNIGEDHFGDYLKKEFEKEGVDTTHLRRVKEKTGVAVCIVNSKGEREIYAYGEANAQLAPAQIDEAYIANAKALYLSSLQGREVFETLARASKTAARSGLVVYFDPGYIFVEKGLTALRRIFSSSTILKFNESEIKDLTGKKDLHSASAKILSLGPKIVLTTLGARGCHVRTKDVSTILPTYKRFKAVDRTGAGDSFNAGFISGHLRGMDLERSVRFGNLVASVSVTKRGARSTPSFDELKRMREFNEFSGKFQN